jgi:hypothetical protein
MWSVSFQSSPTRNVLRTNVSDRAIRAVSQTPWRVGWRGVRTAASSARQEPTDDSPTQPQNIAAPATAASRDRRPARTAQLRHTLTDHRVTAVCGEGAVCLDVGKRREGREGSPGCADRAVLAMI